MNRSITRRLQILGPLIIPIVVAAGVLVYLLDGGGTGSPAQHDGPLSASLESKFVAKLFADLVGRPPRAGEFPTARGVPRSRIVTAVFDSAAARRHRVELAYHALLHRSATANEWKHWLARPPNGNGESLVADVTASEEYFRARGQNRSMTYLHALYSDLTGSPALPAGNALRTMSLVRKGVRAGVVRSVERSQARLVQLVDEDYLLALHRHPDPGGAATYLAVLKSGISNEQVLLDLLESDEYLTDASRVTAPAH